MLRYEAIAFFAEWLLLADSGRPREAAPTQANGWPISIES
jgi:hypothetical protein